MPSSLTSVTLTRPRTGLGRLLSGWPCAAPAAPALAFRLAGDLEALDGPAWDETVRGAGPFLQRAYLSAVRDTAGPDQAVRLAAFHAGGRQVGAAIFRVLAFEGRAQLPAAEAGGRVPSWVQCLGGPGGALAFNVLVCGEPTSAGPHGFRFLPEVDRAQALERLVDALDACERDLAGVGPLDGVLLKDLAPGDEAARRVLEGRGFARLRLEPAMVLTLDPAWTSFEAYLACLASKFRVKAKRAYAKSTALEARPLGAADLAALGGRLMALHGHVAQAHPYRLDGFTLPLVARLVEDLEGTFHLQGYFHQGDLVGFLTAFRHDGVLEAHQVGFDPALNRELGIYPRLLYDYLQLAIRHGCRRLDFGRTATEIKSTLGAQPVETCCYLRHRRCLPNHVVRWVAPRLTPPEAPVRNPFHLA